MEAAWLVLTLLPSCAVPCGKEFPAQSSGCRKEHPSPVALWGGAGLLRKFTDALSWFWMSKCIAMFLLIMLYYYFLVYRWWLRPSLWFWWRSTNPQTIFCPKLAWILAVCRENLSSWSWGCRRIGAPRASLWWELPQSPTGENLKSWGIGRLKETRFWTYCSVLVIIHILFWSLVEVVFCTAEILFLITAVPVLGIYLAVSLVKRCISDSAG